MQTNGVCYGGAFVLGVGTGRGAGVPGFCRQSISAALDQGCVQQAIKHFARLVLNLLLTLGTAKKLAVSSTKSMTGHLLGAAGGIEAVFSAMAVNEQIAPPTINLVNQDPQCDLDYIPNTARKMSIKVAISNSFGFGGTNGTLVFRAI